MMLLLPRVGCPLIIASSLSQDLWWDSSKTLSSRYHSTQGCCKKNYSGVGSLNSHFGNKIFKCYKT